MPAKIEHGESTEATVKKIKTAKSYYQEGNLEFALVADEAGVETGEYPLPANHGLQPEQRVTITPHTTVYKSGGSLTTFELKAN